LHSPPEIPSNEVPKRQKPTNYFIRQLPKDADHEITFGLSPTVAIKPTFCHVSVQGTILEKYQIAKKCAYHGNIRHAVDLPQL
jgi:hypothetical protein